MSAFISSSIFTTFAWPAYQHWTVNRWLWQFEVGIFFSSEMLKFVDRCKEDEMIPKRIARSNSKYSCDSNMFITFILYTCFFWLIFISNRILTNRFDFLYLWTQPKIMGSNGSYLFDWYHRQIGEVPWQPLHYLFINVNSSKWIPSNYYSIFNLKSPSAAAKWIGECPRKFCAFKSAPFSTRTLMRSARPVKIDKKSFFSEFRKQVSVNLKSRNRKTNPRELPNVTNSIRCTSDQHSFLLQQELLPFCCDLID